MPRSVVFGICWVVLMIIVNSAISFSKVEILGIVVTKSGVLFGMLFLYLLIAIMFSQQERQR